MPPTRVMEGVTIAVVRAPGEFRGIVRPLAELQSILRGHSMRIPVSRKILSPAMSLILFVSPLGAQNPIGMFDSQTDVGHPRRPGSASYELDQQSYLIAGSGQNMWGDHDDFHFVWKRVTGNFILSSTRARFIGAGVEPHRKIGWTIRPSLETRQPTRDRGVAR